MNDVVLSRTLRRVACILVAAVLAACGGPSGQPAASPPEPAASSAELEPSTAPASASSVAGSESAAASPVADSESAPAQTVTIRFRTPTWASTQDTRVERQIAFRSVLESFNEQYADQGMQVEEVVADDNPVNITQDVEQGTVDVYWFNHSEYANRMRAGQLLDLAPYLDGEVEQFFPWVQETLRSVDPDTVGALWHNTDTPLYFYNTEKIATPPTTWSELRALAEQVKQTEGGTAYAVSIPFVGWQQFNTGMFTALGGQFVDDNGAPVVFTGENREILTSMLDYYVGLYQDGLLPPAVVTSDQQQQMPDVYAGTVYSFFGNSNYNIRQLKPNLPPEEYEKWAAAPLPYPDEAGSGLYQAGGWMIGAVPSDDQARNAAAAAFVIHATGAEALANTTKAGGWIPTRPAILEADPFFIDDAVAQTTLDTLEKGEVVPLQPVFIPLIAAIQTALQRAAQGEVSIEQAITDAEAETTREYEAIKAQQ